VSFIDLVVAYQDPMQAVPELLLRHFGFQGSMLSVCLNIESVFFKILYVGYAYHLRTNFSKADCLFPKGIND
jgi:hypothetical protein